MLLLLFILSYEQLFHLIVLGSTGCLFFFRQLSISAQSSGATMTPGTFKEGQLDLTRKRPNYRHIGTRRLPRYASL